MHSERLIRNKVRAAAFCGHKQDRCVDRGRNEEPILKTTKKGKGSEYRRWVTVESYFRQVCLVAIKVMKLIKSDQLCVLTKTTIIISLHHIQDAQSELGNLLTVQKTFTKNLVVQWLGTCSSNGKRLLDGKIRRRKHWKFNWCCLFSVAKTYFFPPATSAAVNWKLTDPNLPQVIHWL